MRKLRVRFGWLVKAMICLAIALGCVTMTAPGFTFFGRKYVDLEYDGGMTIKGGYPSIWRLRFNGLWVGEVNMRDLQYHGFPPRLPTPINAPPLDKQFPLTFTLNGVTYNLGELTPDHIAGMGGQVNELTNGLTLGGVPIRSGPSPRAGYLVVLFVEERPVSFGVSGTHRPSEPLDLELSYRGGPPLRLPASENEIRQAFGPPQHRQERVVLPESGGQPLQTAGPLRLRAGSARALIYPPSPASPLATRTPASG